MYRGFIAALFEGIPRIRFLVRAGQKLAYIYLRLNRDGDLPPSCSPAMRRTDCGKHHQAAESGKQAKELDSGSATPLRAATPRQFSRSQSRPTFKFVAPICKSILCASQPGRFPWSNGLDYDSDSVQYTPDFTLHAPGLGFQEFLQLFEFGD
jgi:hypothetical protein